MNTRLFILNLIFLLMSTAHPLKSFAEGNHAPAGKSSSSRPEDSGPGLPFKEISQENLPELGDLKEILEKGAVVFSMNNCPACDALAHSLTEKGIPFKKIKIGNGQGANDTAQDKQNLEKYLPVLKELFKGQRFLFPGVVAPGLNGGVRVFSGNPLFERAPKGADRIFDQIPKHN